MSAQRKVAVPCLILLLATGTAQASAQETVKYIHTDALGSIVAVTDASGQVIERREYEPYGAQLVPELQDGPGYTGHVQDAATELVYMQQRYYDPQIGRFLSVDPITANASTGAGFSRYAYALNNSYKFTDPDGRCGKVTGSHICGGGAGNNVLVIQVNPSSRAQGGQSQGGTRSPTGGSAVQAAIPAMVRDEMRRSWTDSQSSSSTQRHEEGGYHGTEKSNGAPGTRRWPMGSGSSISPPRRDTDGSYQRLNVEGEWHTHPNPPVDGQGRAWRQGGHQGDWNGIRAEGYLGNSYIISEQNVYEVNNSGAERVLGPRSDL